MVNRHRCRNQLSLTKELVIPVMKPDVERVLRVTTTPRVNRIATISRKVIVTGELHIEVEYAALCREHSQPLHFAEFQLPFTHFVDHCLAQPWKEAKVGAVVEFQELQAVSRRTLRFFAILELVVLRVDGVKNLMQPHTCTFSAAPSPCLTGHSVLCCDTGCLSDGSSEQHCACVVPCHDPE